MKLTTSILAVVTMTGGLWAQNPNIITNVQNKMNAVQQEKTAGSNAALEAAGVSAKPAAQQAAEKAATTPAATKNASKPKPQPHDAFVAKKPKAKAAKGPQVVAAKPTPEEKRAEAAKTTKPEEKKWAMTGKRDPFFSPIVQQAAGGSGCSTGKKCLEIGQINVRGVVKSDAGFIAVVTNNLNKAYFLHENDPVFNGYVVKITGDSVVFSESVQDKLGKTSKREVVKRILTPAV
jgi:Tfp pilus assembly protein PilP